jgi:hypothetical protein
MSTNQDTKNDNSSDNFGFPSSSTYDRQKDYPVSNPNSGMTTKQILLLTFGIIIAVLWISMAFIAGYHAFNEWPDVPTWLKMIRVYVAALFAPFYLFFIFLKSTIFAN